MFLFISDPKKPSTMKITKMEFTAVYVTYIVNKGVNRVVYFFCKYDSHDYAT